MYVAEILWYNGYDICDMNDTFISGVQLPLAS